MNPTAPKPQWKALDKQLHSLTPKDYLAINNHSMGQSLITQARREMQQWLMPTTGILLLIGLYGIYEAGFQPITIAPIILYISSLLLLIISLFRKQDASLYTAPIYMGIYSLYYLIIIQFVGGFSIVNLLLGSVYVAFMWAYRERVRQYEAVSKIAISEIAKSTHDALVIALSHNEPNATNKLIKIREDGQFINIWLRSHMIVAYLDGINRIYLDFNHAFELTIAGKDKGGDTLRVTARIDTDQRVGSISRRAWLRYTQYRY